MRNGALAARVGAVVVALALCAGCSGIDVDLSSTPGAVKVGEPVTFDVQLTNKSSCPVGSVTALLIPFVPRNQGISKIEDPQQREIVSEALDAFCTGGNFAMPGSGGCQIVGGDLVCGARDTMIMNVAGQQTAATTTISTDVGDVTCNSDGWQVSCTFPQSMVQMGEELSADATANSLSPLVCGTGPNGQIGVCATPKLDAGETKSQQLMLTPSDPGVARSWVVAFSMRNNGVCKSVAPDLPCSDNSDCPGVTNTCGEGICSGGSQDGYGCDNSGECPDGGECVLCSVPPDGQILSNVACSTTNVIGMNAPVLSPRGLAAAVVLLLGVAYLAFRRVRHQM